MLFFSLILAFIHIRQLCNWEEMGEREGGMTRSKGPQVRLEPCHTTDLASIQVGVRFTWWIRVRVTRAHQGTAAFLCDL